MHDRLVKDVSKQQAAVCTEEIKRGADQHFFVACHTKIILQTRLSLDNLFFTHKGSTGAGTPTVFIINNRTFIMF